MINVPLQNVGRLVFCSLSCPYNLDLWLPRFSTQSHNIANLVTSRVLGPLCSNCFVFSPCFWDSSGKQTPRRPVQPCLTQIPPPEPHNTLRQQRTAADALCIDSVCLVFRVVVDRVSTKRGEEGVTRPGKNPEGEQLLTAQKIHFIMETYWH